MTIGLQVEFVATFEDGTEAFSKGTVADIRDGLLWAFVLGCRWPFVIDPASKPTRGFYPRSEYVPERLNKTLTNEGR